MTLQERFKEAIENTDCDADGIIYYDKAAIACEKIAEEFAEGFAVWCAEKYIWMNGNKIAKKWMKKGSFSAESFTTPELIQKFLKRG